MALLDFVFTSESVTCGHPDKVADQISDGVLDAILAHDPHGRVACETLVTTGLALVAGEVTTSCYVDIPEIVRSTVRSIGYTNAIDGFDGNTCAVVVSLDKQSADISQGVTEGDGLFKEQGAGDQGMMFGYACNQTPELMPLPIALAHRLTERLADARRSGELSFAKPDGKAQVTVRYAGGKPVHVDAVVVSTQHAADVTHEAVSEQVLAHVIRREIPAKLMDSATKVFVNPTGRFVVGGPHGDCGLTGRKIIVDTYGGWGRHGGGAFSGKDPSKVDRSAAYFARYVAKNIVASGLAAECEVQVAYAIGVAQPVSVLVDTFGSEVVERARIETAVKEIFDFRPAAIIKHLDLLRPIYRKTASGGHFGRSDPDFRWERTDRTGDLRAAAGL